MKQEQVTDVTDIQVLLSTHVTLSVSCLLDLIDMQSGESVKVVLTHLSSWKDKESKMKKK